MTLKKSLISVSAAAILVAGITGCSSNSTTAANNNDSSTPTTLTVSDGYVVNYSVVATLNDGNSSTTTTTTKACPTANTKASIVAGSSQTAGTATLDLTKDLTAAEIANLESIAIVYAAQTTNGTALTYGTFFDANSDGKFVATQGDTLITNTAFTMSAPYGYANVTPVTSLVNARIATLTASDTNDTNRSAVEALALTQIAAGLGLSSTDIKNVDPISVASSNPTYTLINSMLGQAITDGDMTAIATSLATATAATDAASALTNIAAGATTGAAFYTSAATQITADPSMLNAVASMNLDGMRSQTAGGATTFTPTYLTPSAADFNVTSITVGNTAGSALTGNGAKVGILGLDDTTLLITKADANVSNKPFRLAIKIGSQETSIADDANISSLTIFMPFDLNNTVTTGLAGAVSGDVKWEGITPAGAFFSGDMNASYFTTTAATTALTVTHLTTTTASVDFDISAIITAIDANSSNAAAIVTGQISDFAMALVDSNSTMQMTNAGSTASTYWGNTQIAATAGTINVTGKSMLKNTLLDGRANAATSTANVAPAHPLTVTVGATGAGTAASPYVVNDNTDITLSVATSAIDTNDVNTTMTFAMSGTASADFELNTTTLSALIKNNAFATNAAAGSDVNTSNTTTIGELNATLTTVQTDEFGESNSTAYYFTINRAPVVLAASFTDGNLTDGNITTTAFFTEYDSHTINATYKCVGYDGVEAAGVPGASECNSSLTATYGIVVSDDNLTLDINSSTMDELTNDQNFTIEITGITDQLTFGISDVNVTLSH